MSTRTRTRSHNHKQLPDVWSYGRQDTATDESHIHTSNDACQPARPSSPLITFVRVDHNTPKSLAI